MVILQIFKKSLMPSYKWEEGLQKIMDKYKIKTEDFAEIKTTSPNEHNQNIEF